MILPLTSTMCGLLLAVSGALTPADQECPAADRRDGTPPSVSAAVDFGGGPRLPLSRIGGRFGVIVVISGRNINIIRRDGSELRLKGILPTDSPVAPDDRRPIIRDDEGWARPEEVPGLLGLSEAWRPAAGRLVVSRSPSPGQSFETFQVRKPAVSRPPEPPTPARPPRRLPKIEVEDGGQQTWSHVAPVEISLALCRLSGFAGPDGRGIYQEIIGPAHYRPEERGRDLTPDSPISRMLSYVSMELSEGNRRYTLGDVFDPLFGTATGIELSSALSANTRWGASLVVPSSRPSERTDGQLVLRAERHTAKGLEAKTVVAVDGSYYASAGWERSRLSLRSSVLHRPDGERRDTSWRGTVLPTVTAFGRTSEAAGLHDARASLLGLQWRLGRAHVGIDRSRAVSSGETWRSDALSVSLLRRNLSGIVRYVANREGAGRSGLEWSLSRVGSSGRSMFFTSSAPHRGDVDGGRSYRFGTRWPVRKGLSVRAGLDWSKAGAHPEGKIEWRPSRDQVVALRYGALDLDLPGSVPERALVLQASLAFGGPGDARRGTGQVVGQVKDDVGHGVADVAVVLDEEEVTLTGADGTYEFRAVEAGRHSVKLDPERLHADLGGELRPRTVIVTEGQAERADFRVARLCRISGRIWVQSAHSEYREPVSGVVVELSTGARLTTDRRGRYSFTGLKPGRYAVSVVSSAHLPGVSPIPPTSWSFKLRAGEQVTGADFGFMRRERPVVFGLLAEEG